jgi:hypothetical protein
MIDRKLLKVINFILLIIRNLNIFYFETTSTNNTNFLCPNRDGEAKRAGTPKWIRKVTLNVSFFSK